MCLWLNIYDLAGVSTPVCGMNCWQRSHKALHLEFKVLSLRCLIFAHLKFFSIHKSNYNKFMPDTKYNSHGPGHCTTFFQIEVW